MADTEYLSCVVGSSSAHLGSLEVLKLRNGMADIVPPQYEDIPVDRLDK